MCKRLKKAKSWEPESRRLALDHAPQAGLPPLYLDRWTPYWTQLAYMTVKRSEQSGGAMAVGPSPANIPEFSGEKLGGGPDEGLPEARGHWGEPLPKTLKKAKKRLIIRARAVRATL